MKTPPYYKLAKHFPRSFWKRYERWLMDTEDKWNCAEKVKRDNITLKKGSIAGQGERNLQPTKSF